jgi:hypothetical protein
MPTPRQHTDQAARQKAYRERQRQARETELAAKGLPALPAIPTMPGRARWTAMLDQARAMLGTMREEMETYHDERSEEWQESERGQEFTANVEAVSELADAATQVEII